MRIQTPRWGSIDVDPSTVIHFETGIAGFPDCSRFVVMDHDRETPLKWLQSLDQVYWYKSPEDYEKWAREQYITERANIRLKRTDLTDDGLTVSISALNGRARIVRGTLPAYEAPEDPEGQGSSEEEAEEP